MMLMLFQGVGVFALSFYIIHSTALLFAPKLSHHLKERRNAGLYVCLNSAASLRNGKLDNILLLSREEELNNFEASTAAGIRTILKCPDVYAVKDILLLTNVTVTQDRPFIVAAALRRVVELSGKYTGDPTSAKMAFSNTQILELMSDLVVNFPSSSSSSSSSSLEAYFCVNVLYSIARMKKRSLNNSIIFHDSVRTFIPNISHPTAQLLSLQHPSWTRQVATKSVVEILWSLAVLHPNSTTPILLQSIAIRLQSSDALGKLSSTEICTVLWAFSQLGSNANNTKHCMIALSKRLRKQNIREATTSWDILKAISAVVKYKKMLQKNHYMNKSQEDNKEETQLYCEFQRLCYLLIRNLCERNNTISNNMRLSALDNAQVLQLLSCMESLHVEVEPHIYHTLLSSILLEDYPMFTWNQALFLLKFQAKHNLPQSGVSELTKQIHVAILYLEERNCTTTNACTTTTTLCDIIRSISTIIPYYPNQTQQPLSNVLNQAMHLLMKQPEYSFCEYSLSILLDSLARCQYTNDEHLYTLGCRVLQPDIVQHCSAKSASKIVWSFAILLGNTTTSQDPILSFTNEKMRRQQLDIFEKFGVALLSSSRLSATDTSRAMWAMAKASYPLDKGIFDHLANHLASFLNKKDLPRVRLVCEALWACGKMIQWEDPLGEELKFGKKSPAQPPYFYAAERFVIFLSTNINEMSTKDISQSIWAAARLGLTPHVTNALFLAPIAQRASEVAPMFNSHELSNILWSLGKLGYNNTAILKALLDPLICSPDATCSPQEAANVMFALGKLHMREVEIFDKMMKVLKMNMNEVTPQCMYNSLWAHESVGLEPPRGFFDVWAQKRLGLPVDFRRKGQLTE